MSSRGRLAALSGVTAASVVVPTAMLVQLLATLAADRSSHVWGLLRISINSAADSTSIGLGVDTLSTLLLWAAAALGCGALTFVAARFRT
jgi:hypothetical protein